jgi:hypothetical protein
MKPNQPESREITKVKEPLPIEGPYVVRLWELRQQNIASTIVVETQNYQAQKEEEVKEAEQYRIQTVHEAQEERKAIKKANVARASVVRGRSPG